MKQRTQTKNIQEEQGESLFEYLMEKLEG